MPKVKEARKETKTKIKDWFKRGDEGVHIKKQQDTQRIMFMEKNVGRFFLKPVGGGVDEDKSKAKIVFVDDVGMYCHMHEIWGDNKKTYIPCVKEFRACPVCQKEGKYPIYTAHYTVIDTREFLKKDGTKVKNRKLLLPAKGAAIYIIADLKKKYGSLVGCVFEVKRYSKEQPTCGGSFEKIGKLTAAQWDKLGKEAKVPVDYMKVLKLPTEEELITLGYGDTKIVGANNSNEGEEVPDDII